MSAMDRHLVLGASGAQGAAIAKELGSHGASVRGVVRSAKSMVPNGVERAVADLADAKNLSSAFEGITHTTVTIPLAYNPLTVNRYAHNIANAAVKVGVKRIVFNANTRLPATATGIAAFDTRTDAERILRASGIPVVCLQPAVYLENLLAPPVASAMRDQGELHYPLPADMRVSWISHGDLAKAVYAAHELDSIPKRAIVIGGSSVSGPELAAELSKALGRPLSFVPLDPALFERSLVDFLDPEVAAGIAGLYRWAFGNPASTLFSDGADDLKHLLGLNALTPHEWSMRQPWDAIAGTPGVAANKRK